ncbi:MAG: hypothetical protein F6K23_07690 [Okeania sp. SIO2C9]|uniref:hypothetical protein n=1 Tax=Okeania sp. SIO2C9 TaxID=2607791 RepID=UPI0013BF2BFB|nr:hypothetical protein [Okeania sp. SIO2C9]NEQ72963.1 hypothetical protein [Okeania sp. SIO2C9]
MAKYLQRQISGMTKYMEWQNIWNREISGIGKYLESGNIWNREISGIGKYLKWEISEMGNI